MGKREYLKLNRQHLENQILGARINLERMNKHGFKTAHGKPRAYWLGRYETLVNIVYPVFGLDGEER